MTIRSRCVPPPAGAQVFLAGERRRGEEGRNASVLENLATLWIHLATVGGKGRDFSFAMQPRGGK